MDLFLIKSLLQKRAVNDSFWKIAELTRLNGYTQLDSAEIKELADKSLRELLQFADQFRPKDIKKLVKQWMVKSSELGIVLVYLGPEKLKHCIPELLEYLQDMNWPAAAYVGMVLRKMPSEILIPQVIRVIERNDHDEIWVRGLCEQIVSDLKNEALLPLKKPLLDFVFDAKHEEDIVEAAKVLTPILSFEEFNQLTQYFNQIFSLNPLAMVEVKAWEDEYRIFHEFEFNN
jgi:hypothetical protein